MVNSWALKKDSEKCSGKAWSQKCSMILALSLFIVNFWSSPFDNWFLNPKLQIKIYVSNWNPPWYKESFFSSDARNPVKYLWGIQCLIPFPAVSYTYLSNKRGGWYHRGGGAKNEKSLNMDGVINVNFWVRIKFYSSKWLWEKSSLGTAIISDTLVMKSINVVEGGFFL